jgi:glutamate formiminotransferase/formiminotetrahydrofolate cyclodeaminase
VKINASGLHDKGFLNTILAKGEELESKAIAAEDSILRTINGKVQYL